MLLGPHKASFVDEFHPLKGVFSVHTDLARVKSGPWSGEEHSTAQHMAAPDITAQHVTAQHSTSQHITAHHSTHQSTSHHSTSCVLAFTCCDVVV